MRSNLVYSAGLKIENRFLLATVVMRAVRKLHIDSTRTEDTANHVFSQVAEGKFISVQMPAVVAAPAIDALLIASAAQGFWIWEGRPPLGAGLFGFLGGTGCFVFRMPLSALVSTFPLT